MNDEAIQRGPRRRLRRHRGDDNGIDVRSRAPTEASGPDSSHRASTLGISGVQLAAAAGAKRSALYGNDDVGNVIVGSEEDDLRTSPPTTRATATYVVISESGDAVRRGGWRTGRSVQPVPRVDRFRRRDPSAIAARLEAVSGVVPSGQGRRRRLNDRRAISCIDRSPARILTGSRRRDGGARARAARRPPIRRLRRPRWAFPARRSTARASARASSPIACRPGTGSRSTPTSTCRRRARPARIR